MTASDFTIRMSCNEGYWYPVVEDAATGDWRWKSTMGYVKVGEASAVAQNWILERVAESNEPKKPARRINLVRLEAESDWRFEVWVQDGPCWNCVYRSDIYPCPKTAAIIGKNWLAENP